MYGVDMYGVDMYGVTIDTLHIINTIHIDVQGVDM
jgi:hypothetical protein